MLAVMEPPEFPVAMGVLYCDPAPTYDESVLAQVEDAQERVPDADLNESSPSRPHVDGLRRSSNKTSRRRVVDLQHAARVQAIIEQIEFMPVTVAIIGAGPSGFYTADVLLKSGLSCEIDIIDRIPAPYGLIRYGVAPDHQTTKNVSRAFEKTALRDEVQYFGNVELGRDVTLDEMKSNYDVVVLAVGARLDKKLGIPGEDLSGVYGSVEFVNWYNGHPDCWDLNPDLNVDAAVVVGNGNVAIDVARVLVKSRQEMSHSDLPAYAVGAIEAAPLIDVYMCGRRGPVEAKFTNVELREMGRARNMRGGHRCIPASRRSHRRLVRP